MKFGQLLQAKIQPPTLNKLISFKDPRVLLEDNWFALSFEVCIYYALLRTYQHARQRGTKAVFLLVSLLCGAFGLELLQQIPHSGYQLWWYHNGMVNLGQHKVPAFVPSFMAAVYYYTDYMMRNSKLPLFSQSAVNAAMATLLVFPCLSLAPNFLILLFHFDDPIFYDRIMNVPYCQLTYIFLLFFHSKYLFCMNYDDIELHERNFFRHLRCAVQSGLVSAIYGLVEVFLLYIVFKLIFHTNSVLGLVFAVGVLAVLSKNELQSFDHRGFSTSGVINTFRRKEWPYVIAFFTFLMIAPLLVKPENLRSTGERLEFGPCDVVHEVSNMSPLNITRKRYVCPNDTAKFLFDFHCVNDINLMNPEVKTEYTICGAPFENPYLVFKTLAMYSFVCVMIFHFLFSFSLKTNEETEVITNGKKID